MKRDRHLKKRGGKFKIVNVSCSKCGKRMFVYQKDGPGWLKRCYINRILEPENYLKIKKIEDMKNLVCSCKSVIGKPITHKDKRLAFKLVRGNFKRTLNKSKEFN